MYGKLFASLYQGTLRGCADEILVFTNLIAHADPTGLVDKHWRAISEECGIDVDRVKAAIARLEAPDPESRSPEENGRRLMPIDEHRAWGWRIVNHAKYRAIRDEEDRRRQNREAQERWRNRHKQSKPRKPKSAESESESESDAEASRHDNSTSKRVRSAEQRGMRLSDDWKPSTEDRAFASDLGLNPDQEAAAFRDYWTALPGARGRKLDWSKTFRNRCRELGKRIKPNGHGLFAERPLPEDPWPQRLKGYAPGKFWASTWGPRPESGQCFAPKELLQKWKGET